MALCLLVRSNRDGLGRKIGLRLISFPLKSDRGMYFLAGQNRATFAEMWYPTELIIDVR